MARYVFRVILVILFIWAIWVGYQYHTKFQYASMLAAKKTEDFCSLDLKTILENAGTGYQYKQVEVNGKKFWIHWLIEKKNASAIKMTGRVNFIELVPFTALRTGISFSSELKPKYE